MLKILHPYSFSCRFYRFKRDPVEAARCSTGLPNIYEMKHPTLTLDSVGQEMHLPATNLRLVDGWIPELMLKLADVAETKLAHSKSSTVLSTSSPDNNMEPIHLLLLTTRFAVRQDVVWDIRCNTGSPIICELNDVTLTAEIADQRTFFPATNLRLIDGWIPVFDATMAGMLRKETTVLVIMRCYVQYFVVREMLQVLILTSNAIRNVRLIDIKLFGIANNKIADLNIKNWRAPNMTSFSVQDNKLQSINTVQLLAAFPKVTSFQYDENPWNCERLESLQFYIKMRPHKVYNFTRSYATCHDRDMVNNVALKLPELIDLSERKLGDLGGRIQHLIEVLWELQCSTGWLNICDLKYATLTEDVTGKGLLLPATNLRMTDGWIPEFDAKMAQLLRPETQTLVILNCYVRLFVIREMLRVLILDGNRVEKIDVFESGSPFEIQFLSVENNQLKDLSFVTRLGKLESLGVNGNKLEVLKMHCFSTSKSVQLQQFSLFCK
ncbi:hypothetical protein pipiens_002451 [Culex pipiens pipiens]|uniref:Uncharacterized protein n=1 Tax=Culex pipiens pipiens TaxID=38569 RepID=A0ABD1DE22_CULPP